MMVVYCAFVVLVLHVYKRNINCAFVVLRLYVYFNAKPFLIKCTYIFPFFIRNTFVREGRSNYILHVCLVTKGLIHSRDLAN